jgi:hypothetical protein
MNNAVRLVGISDRLSATNQNDFVVEQIAENVIRQAEFLRGVGLVVHDDDPR